jgi:hypothetical protein
VQLITDAAALSLGREAMQWSYILRNRKRWADRGPLADEQNQRARTLLEALGASANDLSAIARARVAQMSTPYRTEEEGWALRVLPLEFVLTAATGLQRVGHPDGAAPTPACGLAKGPGLAGAPIGVVR